MPLPFPSIHISVAVHVSVAIARGGGDAELVVEASSSSPRRILGLLAIDAFWAEERSNHTGTVSASFASFFGDTAAA
jgi:hypothetical protein